MLFATQFFVFLLSFAFAAQAAPLDKANVVIPRQNTKDALKVFGDLIASVIAQGKITPTATTSSSSTASSATSSATSTSTSASSTTSSSTSTSSSSTASDASSSTASSTATTTTTGTSTTSTTTGSSSASSATSSVSSTSTTTGSSTAEYPIKTACKNRKYNGIQYATKLLHKSPKKQATLFFGVRDCDSKVNKLLEKGPKRSCKGADFTRKSQSAFYLTDEITAAAQYACYSKRKTRDAVAVFEYDWTPSPSLKVYEFSSPNRVWHAFVRKSNRFCGIGKNDVIAGPMSYRKDITGNYWQYALTSDNAMKGLKLKTIHRGIKCSTIPRGNLC